MNITDLKFRRIKRESELRALVSLTVDNEFAIHDIKIIQGKDRLFVAMPSRRDSQGVFRDIVHPINQEMRQYIEKTVLEAYDFYIQNYMKKEDDEACADSPGDPD